MIAEGGAERVLPVQVMAELGRILTTKIGLDPNSIAEMSALLQELEPEMAEAPEEIEAISGDPDDDRILAAAVAAGADVLVSGDGRHLLPLGSHAGVRIIKPQALLAQMLR